MRGVDLAFEHAVEVTVTGELPSGGQNTVTAKIPTIAAYVCMKSITMTERKKEKDAYDIYFSLEHYSGGPAALASTFGDLRGIEVVEEALRAMRSVFKDTRQIGPVWAAQVAEEAGAPETPEQVRRRSYELAKALLDTLGIE